MSTMIYLNGELLRPEDARISPFDRGFLFGDGMFETIRIYDGRGHLVGRHLRRLAAAADVLAIALPSHAELADAIARTIAANNARNAVLRLTVTRGVSDAMLEPDPACAPTIMIALRPLSGDAAGSTAERLITLASRHMMPEIGRRVKSLSYQTAIYSARELAAAGVREGILCTADGIVAEGTVSNLFCTAGGVVYTPPLGLGLLDGITRGRTIELASGRGIAVREQEFDRDFLLRADECFYTNSVREIVPVGFVDDVRIGNGHAGHITSMLLDAYRAEAPGEIG